VGHQFHGHTELVSEKRGMAIGILSSGIGIGILHLHSLDPTPIEALGGGWLTGSWHSLFL